MITTGVISYNQAQTANFERTTAFSADLWLYYPSARNTQGGLLRRSVPSPTMRGWEFYLGSSRNLGLTLVSDNTTSDFLHVITTSASLFNFATWTHLAFTYDGSGSASGIKLYVNNSSKALTVVRNTLTGSILNDGPFVAGHSTWRGYLPARLDEIAVYERCLSASEVSQRYNSGVGTEALFGSAYLRYCLNESSGSVVNDSSGNNRHAATVNAPAWMAGKLNNCLSLNGSTQHITSLGV